MATGMNIRCPACGGALVPVGLKCKGCELTITGEFVSNEFASLGEEDLHFLRIFVHCEGRIREMEAALGVSYPTIKNRLGRLKEALGVVSGQKEDVSERNGGDSTEILVELEAGRITFEEAKERLKRASAGEET
jgi:hypothetical protein